MSSIQLSELSEQDLPFLLDLWRTPDVMRHADEFPRLRGWTKKDDPATAWRLYQEQRARHGPPYTQLIVYLLETAPSGAIAPGAPIGEAAILPLPEGYTFGKWEKPAGALTVIGDIKLAPQQWGRGLGTIAMRQVVAWVFQHTEVDTFVVPPHRRNPAAARVYEKAGFCWYSRTYSYYGHHLMTLSRAQFMSQTNAS